jgi:hypothetical protein
MNDVSMRPRQAVDERDTVLDDRLLHMTREEAKACLDEYMRQQDLAMADEHPEKNGTA